MAARGSGGLLLCVEAYNNRGLSYRELGRRAEAIADFRKAQSIDTDDQISRRLLRMLGF
jgi:hypothetical protein